jgi:hypothetical protein
MIPFLQSDCGRSESGIKEKADCTVRATAACLGITYAQAHQQLKMVGRKTRCRFKFWKATKALGLITREDLSCMSLAKALPHMQQGRFIVRKAGHVFAVVNGVVIDHAAPKELSHIIMVYQFVTEPELEPQQEFG